VATEDADSARRFFLVLLREQSGDSLLHLVVEF
jgi:hypothetical protein